jgi:hypothetical protein
MTQAAFEFRQDVKRDFDGQTYEPKRDKVRLNRQLDKVKELMLDGKWRCLRQIESAVGGTEASVSARLRDLRKPKFGGFTVEREYRGKGLFVYRMRT